MIVGQDLSRKSSDLARLLHIARRDAYENSNPVVLVLMLSGGQSTRRKSGIAVLFGPLIGPFDPKRYGNCIVVEPQGNRFIIARRDVTLELRSGASETGIAVASQ